MRLAERCASARCNGRPSARPRSAASRADEVRGAGARLRHDQAGGDPPELRHAARARRRQCGARRSRACRALVGAWRASRRRAAAVELGLVSPRRPTPALQRPDLLGRAPAAHHQHEHDRRRPAARPARRDGCVRPEDRGADRLQQQPGRGRAASRPRWCAGFAREDLFTVVLEHFHDRHRRLCRLRAAGHHAARALGRAHQLRPHLRAAERAGDRRRAGRRSPTPRSSASWRARMGFDEPCFADERRERCARSAFGPSASTSTQLRAARLGQAAAARGAVRRRRLPDRRRALRFFSATGAGPAACPTTCRTTSVRSAPELGARFPLAMISPPARNFLNSTFVNVQQPARHRGRAAAGDPCRTTPRRAASPTATMVRVFNDRGEYRCKARGVASARGPGVVNGLGVWWRKLGLDGTNVNELTHQRLTDMGRAPVVLRLPGRSRAPRRRRRRP